MFKMNDVKLPSEDQILMGNKNPLMTKSKEVHMQTIPYLNNLHNFTLMYTCSCVISLQQKISEESFFFLN